MLHPQILRTLVRRALDEDLPDITSESMFDRADRGMAVFVSKGEGVIAGLDFAAIRFAELDDSSWFDRLVEEGTAVEPGRVIAEASASVEALLSGERTALNFVQRASGIATATRRYVEAVRGTKARIYDTRKTAPARLPP